MIQVQSEIDRYLRLQQLITAEELRLKPPRPTRTAPDREPIARPEA